LHVVNLPTGFPSVSDRKFWSGRMRKYAVNKLLKHCKTTQLIYIDR
jgi:hypothetical protein